MSFDQHLNEYIDELRFHLFDDMKLEDIIGIIDDHHQARRFIAMYIMKDKETFQSFFKKRVELGIEKVYNKVVLALFSHTEKLPVKKKIISRLGVTQEMATSPVTPYEIKEMNKDLQAFIWQATKKVLSSPVI